MPGSDRALKLGVMLGDDIGLEVVPETKKVIDAAAARSGLKIEWDDLPVGRRAFETLGSALPDGTLEKLDALDGWLLGPLGHRDYPRVPGAFNAHPIMRKHFHLFANIQRLRSYRSLPCIHQGVDLVIARENTEGFQPDRNMYAGSGEFQPSPEMSLSVRVITRKASNDIARSAFELAKSRRRKVTAVHKSSVFKMTDGMFAEECRKVAGEYPGIELEEVMVDTFAMRLVMKPQQYDVIVTSNMYGDILNDEAAGLVGGLGMAPRINAGERHVMAQATHGSAPDIAGKNVANPYAMIMSGQMMLEVLGRRLDHTAATEAARAIERACEEVIEKNIALTPDLGGTASTQQMGDAIAARV
jgi:3-isopropylmalate dehydrogenase